MTSEESYLIAEGNESASILGNDENGYDIEPSSSKICDKEEQAKIRREKDKIRARERRKKENEEAKKDRREKCRLAQAERRKGETAEQRERRLIVDRERAKKRRLKESEEEKQHRLEMNRIRTAIRRRGTVDTAIDALKIFNDDPEVKELLQIPGNRVIQLENTDDPTRISIGVVNESDESVFYKLVPFKKETDEQKQIRLERGREYAAKRRRQETAEQRERRLERERNSVRRRRQKHPIASSSSRPDSANYDSENLDETHSEIFDPNAEMEVDDALRTLSPSPEINNSLTPDDDFDEPHSNVYSENEMPIASISADPLSNINGYLFGNTPLSVPAFSTNDVSSLLDFSIYSHVLHPSTSSISDNWPQTTDNALKDKSDMYLIQNLGIDSSTSPSSNIFNNLAPPQALQPSNFFQNSAPVDDPTNPMTIGMLLRNLSNTQQAMEAPFNSSPFGSSLLGASTNVFGSFDARIDSLLCNPSTSYFPSSINGMPSVSEADDGNLDSDILSAGLRVSSAGLESLYNCLQPQTSELEEMEDRNSEPEETHHHQSRHRSMIHFDKIVQNSFDSFILLLESTVVELINDGAQIDFAELSHCPDMSIIPNPNIPNTGLHLVVSSFMIETQDIQLKNYYYTSIDRLLKIRAHFDPLKLYGNEEDDRAAWSEMYDTLRSIHVEIVRSLWEKSKTDSIDTFLFNAVERAELLIKRIQNRRRFPSIDRMLTFLDLALIELLQFLDHVAQISWMIFPSLAQERAEIQIHQTFKLYCHKNS